VMPLALAGRCRWVLAPPTSMRRPDSYRLQVIRREGAPLPKCLAQVADRMVVREMPVAQRSDAGISEIYWASGTAAVARSPCFRRGNSSILCGIAAAQRCFAHYEDRQFEDPGSIGPRVCGVVS
jgi:hypothetical protein